MKLEFFVVMESAGISTVQLDCHAYFHTIKAEKSIPIKKEAVGASDVEDSRPVIGEVSGPSTFHDQQTESFCTVLCNSQDNEKLDPIEISNSFFNNPEFENLTYLSSEDGKDSITMSNGGLSKFDFCDQIRFISSLTHTNANEKNDIVTYAEIHPVPNEFSVLRESIGIDSTGSSPKQNISCISPHSGIDLPEHIIKQEAIETTPNEVFIGVGNTDINETPMSLRSEKYSIPMDVKFISPSLVGETTAQSVKLSMTPSLTGKQENYVTFERVEEPKASLVVTNHNGEIDPEGSGLKRKLSALKISVSPASYSQSKKQKLCMKTSRSDVKDEHCSYKPKNVLDEQFQLHCKDNTLQIQDFPEKAVDVSLDCERTRRTTFIDFKPEVLESRTRRQQNTHGNLQGRRGKRKRRGVRPRGRRKVLKLSSTKNIRRTRLQKSPKKMTHHNEPPLDSISRENLHSIFSIDNYAENNSKNSQQQKENVFSEIPEKDGVSRSNVYDVSPYLKNHNNLPLSPCVHPNELQTEDKNKINSFRHHTTRRRRLKSGLDMIKRKKNYVKKKTVFPPILKVQTEKKKPEVTDLRKLVVNKSLGESPLHRAARQGNLDLISLCISSKFCSVNISDNAGYTPLHEACSKGHLEAARILLQNEADPNACATGGIRPIHDSVENDHVEIARLLLSYGADPTIATYSGRPLTSFAKSSSMAEFLRGFFADVGQVSDVSLLDLPSTSTTTWSFAGSAGCLDPQSLGYNVCNISGLLDSDVPDDDPGFLFEMSDSDIVPTFLFSSSSDTGPQKYVLLCDVLKHLGLSEVEFSITYPDVTVVTVSLHDFRAHAACCQLFVNPDTTQNSYNVQILLYTEQIRSILGIEAMYIEL